MTASERPHDAGGPRPENQRKRTELRKARHSVVGMFALVAVSAITLVVVRRSDDHALGMPPGYLTGASGLVPALVIAGAHALAAFLVATHAPRARVVAAMAATLLMVSGVVLFTTRLGVMWLPALLMFAGFVELMLVAGSTPRKPPKQKHVPGRR